MALPPTEPAFKCYWPYLLMLSYQYAAICFELALLT